MARASNTVERVEQDAVVNADASSERTRFKEIALFGKAHSPRCYRPEIALVLGSIDQAVVLDQLHYWLNRATKYYNDRWWVYKRYAEWGSELGSTPDKARRALEKLRDAGYAVSIRNPQYG